MRKFLILCSISLAALFIISSYQNEGKSSSKEYSSTASKKNRYRPRGHHHSHKHAEKSRKIASVPSTDPLSNKADKTASLTEVSKQLTKEDIEVINKVKKNLPNLAESEFEIVKRLKITGKSIYIVNRDVNGMAHSFTAIIDNKTGRIEKSWGKTRYESPLSTKHYPAVTY